MRPHDTDDRDTNDRDTNDRGSTIPLILGFFLLALIVVAGSVAVGAAFVQTRNLQDLCDGAVTSAAASAADLDRGKRVVSGGSLRFADVADDVAAYLHRDPSRRAVDVRVSLTDDRRRVTLRCRQTRPLPFGRFFDHGEVQHTVYSSARAAVYG